MKTYPPAFEVNFDGIVGPTHTYAGLSYGNLASQQHRHAASSPKQAALQGLEKMRLLARLGVKQAVLPPHERPDVRTLRRLGFSGSDAGVLEAAHRQDPVLLHACSSASAMWAANAATVSPGADSNDGRVHFTPANLVTLLHRSLEAETTSKVLHAIFQDDSAFAHHEPLPTCAALSDEGAANHTRLCRSHGEPGIEIFTFGRSAMGRISAGAPVKFPGRQTLEASNAIARRHLLDPGRTMFVQQSPAAIDAGAFHNDVVAVGNENVLLMHEQAFAPGVDSDTFRRAFETACGGTLHVIVAPAARVSLEEVIRTYLFNSQLVTLPDQTMALIAPTECLESAPVRAFIDELLASDNPVASVHYVNLRESMRNGGGPACVRLRVTLTEPQLACAHPGVFLTESLYKALTAWIQRHYREQLHPNDLADPKLLEETRAALDELTRLLKLPSIYPFQ